MVMLQPNPSNKTEYLSSVCVVVVVIVIIFVCTNATFSASRFPVSDILVRLVLVFSWLTAVPSQPY